MRLSLTLAALIILTPTHGIADVTRMHVCERASITRIVELQSDGENGLPCRVLYKRPMEDQSATSLWNAQSDANYCAQKYDEFVAKIEKKHNWSCTATLPGLSNAPAVSKFQTTMPETSAPLTDSSLSIAETKLQEAKEASTTSEHNRIANLPSPVERVKPLITIPELGSALPLAKTSQAFDKGLSMALIRQLIPSGQYVMNSETPHSGNVALCPADGFFIWSTKQPGRPAFEMGPSQSFQFDLTQLTDEPVLTGVDIAAKGQCREEVAAGYCSDSVYTGSTPLHSQLSRHFGCGSSAGNTAQQNSLVLFRSSDDQTSSCLPTPLPRHMALAPAGNSQAVDAHTPADGIELLILPDGSKSAAITPQDGAICRYIRG